MKLMGGSPPGTFSGKVPDIELAPSDVAWRAQTFYDMRNNMYPEYYKLQNEYYALAEGAARNKYLNNHPELASYWDWRRDWLYRNPDVAPYLVDDETKLPKYKSETVMNQVKAAQPDYTWQEWQSYISPPVSRLVIDHANGKPISDATRKQLEDLADRLGIDYNELIAKMILSYENR
jgi:hypothetical protein